MFNKPSGYLSDLKINWRRYEQFLEKIDVPARTRLLNEGEVADKLFVIEKGSVRLGYNHEGKDITFQFFFEDELLTSIESLFGDVPSRFFIETIERTKAFCLTKGTWDTLIKKQPEMTEINQRLLLVRLIHYSTHLLSHLRDKPMKRYQNLIKNRPFIFRRIPQRHIASYLGITNVSLSRMKGRKEPKP